MSKFAFVDGQDMPRITKRLYLRDYNDEFRAWLKEQGQENLYLDIWLNWSKEFDQQMRDMNWLAAQIAQDAPGAEGLDDSQTKEEKLKSLDDQRHQYLERVESELMPLSFKLNARFWGCDEEDVRWVYERDQELWQWIVERSGQMREEYQETRKKGARATGTS